MTDAPLLPRSNAEAPSSGSLVHLLTHCQGILHIVREIHQVGSDAGADYACYVFEQFLYNELGCPGQPAYLTGPERLEPFQSLISSLEYLYADLGVELRGTQDRASQPEIAAVKFVRRLVRISRSYWTDLFSVTILMNTRRRLSGSRSSKKTAPRVELQSVALPARTKARM